MGRRIFNPLRCHLILWFINHILILALAGFILSNLKSGYVSMRPANMLPHRWTATFAHMRGWQSLDSRACPCANGDARERQLRSERTWEFLRLSSSPRRPEDNPQSFASDWALPEELTLSKSELLPHGGISRKGIDFQPLPCYNVCTIMHLHRHQLDGGSGGLPTASHLS